jgi:cytochrome c biogenesis factor
MFLYFYKLESMLLLITITYSIIFLSKSASSIVSIDSLTRIDINLFDFNSIYFLWTNIDYIYIYFIPFIFLIIQVVFAEFSSQTSTWANIIMLALAVLLTQLASDFNINACADNISSSANLLLFNAINKYHPLLLYVATLGLISIVILTYQPLNIYKTKSSALCISSFTTYIMLIILTTMYAGSWWAYQEGSWGGWWAWDPSETFGLVIMLSAIKLYHFKFLKKKSSLLNLFQLIAAVSIITTYTFLQLNFGITSHNFGLKDSNDSLTANAYVSLILFMIAFVYIFFLNAAHINNLTNYASLFKSKINYYLLITLLPVFLSLLPLATDLLWKKFEMNAINFAVNYYLISGLILGILMQWFNVLVNGKAVTYFILSLIFISNHILALQLVLFISIIKLNNFGRVHLILLVYIFSSWASNTYLFNHWVENYSSSSLLLINIEVLNYPLISDSTLNSLFNSTYATISNSSNALNSGIFFLESYSADYAQLFKSDNNRISLMSITYDGLTFLLPLLFFILLKYLLSSLSSKYVIKC